MEELVLERMSLERVMGMSPEVGVSRDSPEVLAAAVVGESSPRRRSRVAGESWGARCDLRLSRSMSEMAQSLRSTGVRLAAWTKGSRSYVRLAGEGEGESK